MVTNTYGDITPRQAVFSSKRMLERGKQIAVFEQFGQIDPQGQNKGKIRAFRRYEALAPATAPMAEGITPPGSKITLTDVTCTLEQFGDNVPVTDVITEMHEDPVLMELSTICGEQAVETIELVRYSHLKAGSNVVYANSVASRATVDSPPLAGDFKKIRRSLSRNRGQEFSEILAATVGIGTLPVERAFFAVGSTDLRADLRNLSGYIPVANYSSSNKALPGEDGTFEGIRFILTTLAEPWQAVGAAGTTYLNNGSTPGSSLACDVYPILIFAKNSYAIVPLAGKNAITPRVIKPGTPTKDDPHGQRGFVAWETWQTCAILNQTWLVRYEVACTANPT